MTIGTRISLIEQLRSASDEEAWSEFVRIYDQLIFNWLSRERVQLADAEDIRQEVMATVLSEIKTFEHSGRTGAFRRWLRTITANRMRRVWARKSAVTRRQHGADLSVIADQLEDDDSRLTLEWNRQHDSFLLRRLLDKLVDRFPDEQMQAFHRVVIDQQPAAEVAADFNLTLGHLRVIQHRILRALREASAGVID
ncbi:MAG: sigma-70 family RNA polymerase sigma factor [Planctomycetota bacterium]